MVILPSDVHELNASEPILTRLSGRLTVTSDEQPQNAQLTMDCTPSFIVTEL